MDHLVDLSEKYLSRSFPELAQRSSFGGSLDLPLENLDRPGNQLTERTNVAESMTLENRS